MKLDGVALLYLVVGTCAAVACLVSRRGPGRLADALLLLIIWPLYGPFVWSRRPEAPASELERARARLVARAAELSRVLAGDDFDLAAGRARLAALEAVGHGAAPAAARGLQNAERLHALRDRYDAELTAIDELSRQLRTQSELVRLTGEVEADMGELTAELLARLETLELEASVGGSARVGVPARR